MIQFVLYSGNVKKYKYIKISVSNRRYVLDDGLKVETIPCKDVKMIMEAV